MPITAGDRLSLWVTYQGWDDIMNTQGSMNLSVGSLVTFNEMPLRPTFKRLETNAMLDPTTFEQKKGIPANDTTPYNASSLYISQ